MTIPRLGVVSLLIAGAYVAADPWLRCSFGFVLDVQLLRICTFGWPEARIAGHYPELAVAAVDVMAALWLVNDRRRI